MSAILLLSLFGMGLLAATVSGDEPTTATEPDLPDPREGTEPALEVQSDTPGDDLLDVAYDPF